MACPPFARGASTWRASTSVTLRLVLVPFGTVPRAMTRIPADTQVNRLSGWSARLIRPEVNCTIALLEAVRRYWSALVERRPTASLHARIGLRGRCPRRARRFASRRTRPLRDHRRGRRFSAAVDHRIVASARTEYLSVIVTGCIKCSLGRVEDSGQRVLGGRCAVHRSASHVGRIVKVLRLIRLALSSWHKGAFDRDAVSTQKAQPCGLAVARSTQKPFDGDSTF